MSEETVSLLLVPILLIIVSFLFIKIAIRTRKFGGSMTTNLLASTYDFMNKEKRKASEEIVEIKSDKKMEEESNGELESNKLSKK